MLSSLSYSGNHCRARHIWIMKKFFNIAGPCIPGEHYMLPAQARLGELHGLIEQGQYFVIHAARQSGKTTLLLDLVKQLNEDGTYHAAYCSLESVQGITDPKEGIPAIVAILSNALRNTPALRGCSFGESVKALPFAAQLNQSLAELCASLDKPLVLMFDEVDCLNNGTLISFLRQLREGFVSRSMAPFVHSVALVGMRNIRDYKATLRKDQDTLGSASPFNIVKRSLTLRNFTPDEVTTLYAQYSAETGQDFGPAVVDRVFHFTQGQPWLVNAIAAEIIETILQHDTTQKILPEHVDTAAQNLVVRRDTHIDSLLERLKEERVRRIIEPIIVGAEGRIKRQSDDYEYVRDLGMTREDDGVIKPANPIYAEVISRALNYDAQQDLSPDFINRWISDAGIDMNALLQAFQEFWRENSDVWVERFDYREAAPHLVLTAFLQRVINGGGRIIREYAAGRKRLDLCVVYENQKYPLELKLHYGPKTEPDGLTQLADYMDTLGVEEGWLIIFDRDSEKTWDERIGWRTDEQNGRVIHVIGC